MGIGQAQPSVSAINAARGCAPRIFAQIDRESAIDPLDEAAGAVLDTVAGDLALVNVDFTYPTRQGELILRQLSLSASRGQTLALVGASGCGKVRRMSSRGMRCTRLVCSTWGFRFCWQPVFSVIVLFS